MLRRRSFKTKVDFFMCSRLRGSHMSFVGDNVSMLVFQSTSNSNCLHMAQFPSRNHYESTVSRIPVRTITPNPQRQQHLVLTRGTCKRRSLSNSKNATLATREVLNAPCEFLTQLHLACNPCYSIGVLNTLRFPNPTNQD